MKKFIINAKGKTSIIEVECTKLTPMDTPSVGWLPQNEYKARIDAPTSLFDKIDNKLEKPVWYSFAFFDTLEEAKTKASADIKVMLERNEKKTGSPFTEEDINKQLVDIQIITL